jgi:hypothetical protein
MSYAAFSLANSSSLVGIGGSTPRPRHNCITSNLIRYTLTVHLQKDCLRPTLRRRIPPIRHYRRYELAIARILHSTSFVIHIKTAEDSRTCAFPLIPRTGISTHLRIHHTIAYSPSRYSSGRIRLDLVAGRPYSKGAAQHQLAARREHETLRVLHDVHGLPSFCLLKDPCLGFYSFERASFHPSVSC